MYFMHFTSYIVGPISNSHVFIIIGTLGLGNEISLIFEIKGMDYDCYTKCGGFSN
jgi:hypothetical protein